MFAGGTYAVDYESSHYQLSNALNFVLCIFGSLLPKRCYTYIEIIKNEFFRFSHFFHIDIAAVFGCARVGKAQNERVLYTVHSSLRPTHNNYLRLQVHDMHYYTREWGLN